MRNKLNLIVCIVNGGLAVHFTQADIVKDPKAFVSIPVNGTQMMDVAAPTKLQGSDFELWFPLTATINADEVNFEEIERIMVINRVANNVTDIHKKFGDESLAEYSVTYNEWVHPDQP